MAVILGLIGHDFYFYLFLVDFYDAWIDIDREGTRIYRSSLIHATVTFSISVLITVRFFARYTELKYFLRTFIVMTIMALLFSIMILFSIYIAILCIINFDLICFQEAEKTDLYIISYSNLFIYFALNYLLFVLNEEDARDISDRFLVGLLLGKGQSPRK